uniref:hypersensitive-induced response protein 1-like n=1 Tax=Erigeron canadensis TaxID=72917 RepID=UPI001CB9CA28|nr:hypersensitive-induced response protein 1-like [Erigeron canadensis]
MGNALGCIQVEESTLGIKETFGEFENVLTPGCHLMPWCIGSELAGYVSLSVQHLDVRCETMTKDNYLVTVVASVQYRALADKAIDAYYKLSNPKEHIQAYVFDVIKAIVPTINLAPLPAESNYIEKSVKDQLDKVMSMYGYKIVRVVVDNFEFDESVKTSIKEIVEALILRAAENEQVETEKVEREKQAQIETDFKYYSGMGTALQHQAILNGLKKSVAEFTSNVPGTSAKDVMDMILVTRYFDTIKEIGALTKSTSELWS